MIESGRKISNHKGDGDFRIRKQRPSIQLNHGDGEFGIAYHCESYENIHLNATDTLMSKEDNPTKDHMASTSKENKEYL